MSMRVNSLRDRQGWQTDLLLQTRAGIVFAQLDGYFSVRRQDSASASDSFQPRSFNAQTTSGDLQSGAGTAPHRERSNGLAAELPVLRWNDRERTESFSAAPAIARHAEMHGVRANGSLYRGSRVDGGFPLGPERPCSCTRSSLECTSVFFPRESQTEISPS